MALPQKRGYTVDDIYALPDSERAELIDGQLYMMAPPSTSHQRISHILAWEIENHIRHQKGDYMVFTAPFAVFLNEDRHNYVEPDISVICNKSKLDEHGCKGAPDWVIEITSPSTSRIDYGVKLFKYRMAGVREYWIVNPLKQTVTVYDFEHEEKTDQYSFMDTIPVCIYDDLNINLTQLLS